MKLQKVKNTFKNHEMDIKKHPKDIVTGYGVAGNLICLVQGLRN
jgi:hypothetical protein